MTYRYIPPFGMQLLQIVVLVEAITRGLAYMLTPQSILADTDIVNTAPLWAWGSLFVGFGLLGLFGEALMSGVPLERDGNPRAWPSFIAHVGLMTLYVTLSLAYLNAVADGETSLASAPAGVLGYAFIHWLFARRRKSHVT